MARNGASSLLRGAPLREQESRQRILHPSPAQVAHAAPDQGVKTPAQELQYIFPYQSYYSSTLLEQAIMDQPLATQIVQQQTAQLRGYAVGLAPWSETPIAVRFNGGSEGQKGTSQVIHLKPGMIVRPQGEGTDGRGAFSGLFYGLPFGWLGGGLACLYVFQTADAYALWPGDSEVCFHRQRALIGTSLAPISTTPGSSYNWPGRFPWTNARSQSALAQGNNPAISLTRPTRTLMRLRDSVNVDTMYMLYRGVDSFDIGSNGLAPTTTDVSGGISISWPLVAPAGVPASYPTVVQIDSQINRFYGDSCRMDLTAATSSPILGDYVDISRWGIL